MGGGFFARAGLSSGSGVVSTRFASASAALSRSSLVPYFVQSGEAFATASRSGAGSMLARGARRRVCTTGVGTRS